MRLLLDTHTVVWAALKPSRLSERVRDVITDADNERFVSAVSAYEIAYKRPRDAELSRLPVDLEDLRRLLVFDWLSVDHHHASRAADLPRHHGDPWDRVIVAQALADDLTIISIDTALPVYGARILW